MTNTRILGKDLEVSAIGLGCMGFTHAYGKPEDEISAAKVIRNAADIVLSPSEIAAIDKSLAEMNMSGVFGGSPVKKGYVQ